MGAVCARSRPDTRWSAGRAQASLSGAMIPAWTWSACASGVLVLFTPACRAVAEAPSAAAPLVAPRASTSLETPPIEPATEPPARPARPFTLPEGWSALSPEAFGALLDTFPTDGTLSRLDEPLLRELGDALARSDTTSVRAAALLARTRDPRAFDLLIARLEARVGEGMRELGGDIVAAAAAVTLRSDDEAALRLEELATGRNPHPALLVRVECALAALAARRDGAIPFLLDFLREGTTAAVKRPSWRRIDWNDERQLRTQDRVARALSARAGVDCTYRARGPLASRESEIARLAGLLAGAPRSNR